MTTTFTRDPKFGYDPWLGTTSTIDPSLDGLRVFSGADTLKDAIGLLPSGLDLYMSYVDNFGGWNELVSRFGKTGAHLIPITIFGNPAQCADVEPGAMHASSLPHWLDHVAQRPNGDLPWVYTSAGMMSTVNQFIGGRKVIRWSAHYGFGPHICGPHTCGFPQADWTQWTDTGPGGQNYDRSIGAVLPGPPPPSDPHHYAWFSGDLMIHGQKIHERDTVEEYDRRRPFPKSLVNRKRLVVLEHRLRLLATRVFTVAHQEPHHNGAPSWDKYHRGWRYQQLAKRAAGQKLV